MGERVDTSVVCLITTPTDQASAVAEAIVSRQLVACVNVVPLVKSVYWWEGKVEQDDESLLVIKTTRGAVEPMTEVVREVHPYDNFELVALDIQAGAPAYLDWIVDSVKLPG
jgi:periplasmic divalent cation tolerance protein